MCILFLFRNMDFESEDDQPVPLRAELDEEYFETIDLNQKHIFLE